MDSLSEWQSKIVRYGYFLVRSENAGYDTGIEGPSYRELRLLEEIQQTPEISQRRLAQELGVALGVANALLRNLASQGYVRATNVGWKRWMYVLTPEGVSRKVALTRGYIERFVEHYRRVREMLRHELLTHSISHNSRIAILGTGDMAEMVFLALKDLGYQSVEFCDVDGASRTVLGNDLVPASCVTLGRFDTAILAFSGDDSAVRHNLLSAGFAHGQIVTLLNGDAGPTGEQFSDAIPIQEGVADD